MNHLIFNFKQVQQNNEQWFDTMFPILAHNTSKKNKPMIVFGGFHLKDFASSSKRMNYDFEGDPKGVSFTLRKTPFVEEKLSWAGVGNTTTVYSIPIFNNPFIVWTTEWKEAIHAEFKTKGNGLKLTKVLEKKGYDSIISRYADGDGFGEIVALQPSKLLNFYSFEEALSYYDFLKKEKMP